MALRPSLAPSAFQGGCRHPERVVVTHPFNPPHLIPLVEVVGGARTCKAAIEAAMAAMTRLGRSPIRLRAELPGHVVNRLQAALWREAYHLVGRGVVSVADADFVQENGPEREDVKHALFDVLDGAAAPEVVLASSSSGLLPSAIARGCSRHPERVLIGHPFNPPHLIPLVEVVPGEKTTAEAANAAMAFYAAVGKRPILLRRELPGHVTNRLQAALWREAYSLVERGIASVSDIDTAISQGPGLRWAVLGPFVNQHLSGGAGGLAHVLEHLGPPMVEGWKVLRNPQLTPELARLLVAGVEDELAGIDQARLVADRDRLLNMLLSAKSKGSLP